MSHEHVITKTTPISRVAEALRTEPDLVRPADSLYTVALKMAWKPIGRVLCVVGPERRLLGLITLRVIAENVFYGAGNRTAGIGATRTARESTRSVKRRGHVTSPLPQGRKDSEDPVEDRHQVAGAREPAADDKGSLEYPEAREIARGETAEQLMEVPVWVRPADTVKDAVDKMLAAHLDGLPIVDGDMRVVGYIDLMELLRLWLGATGLAARS